jgi:hypothetical protein
MRTPEEQAIYNAERPIYDASADLDRCAGMLDRLRATLGMLHLPPAVATDHLDDMDDLLAIVASRLARAGNHVAKEIDRLQDAEQARHDAAEDDDTARERELLEFEDAHGRPANDDLATLAASLRRGVL